MAKEENWMNMERREEKLIARQLLEGLVELFGDGLVPLLLVNQFVYKSEIEDHYWIRAS